MKKNKSKSLFGGVCKLTALIISTALIIGNYFEVKAQELNFSYTGSVEEYTVEYSGYYLLEVWGGSGGYDRSGPETFSGGYGGYSKGVVYLNEGDVLYICIGGKGTNCDYTIGIHNTGGYNGGGGSWCSGSEYEGGGGGGATHIALNLKCGDGQLYNYSGNKNSVLIVAGGGGGACTYNHWYSNGCPMGTTWRTRPDAGGLQAPTISWYQVCTSPEWDHPNIKDDLGVDYDVYECNADEGQFSSDPGVGQSGSSFGRAGNTNCGGGWYGGVWQNSWISGSGGSSYIGGCLSSYTVNNVTYTRGTSSGSNSGDGKARITSLHTHEFERVVTTEPTCLEKDVNSHKRTICGYIDKTEDIDALGHDKEEVWSYDRVVGYHVKDCKRCWTRLEIEPNTY